MRTIHTLITGSIVWGFSCKSVMLFSWFKLVSYFTSLSLPIIACWLVIIPLHICMLQWLLYNTRNPLVYLPSPAPSRVLPVGCLTLGISSVYLAGRGMEKKWRKICKCQLNPPPFIKMCVCVCVLKIYTVGCFNSSWSKTGSFSHPLSKRICARKGVIFNKAFDCPTQNRAEELMLSNCDAREDSWESLELQGDQTQSILKEINPEYSLERLMLKLKLQYFGHLIRRAH